MAQLPNTFEIGLVCAGAVSGGAYTAGAMDFLIEALDAWYAAKRDDPGSVPGHDVLIRALAGASAGSMCSAIAAVALAGDFPPVRPDSPTGTSARNPFYDSWVSAIDIVDLLTTDDLEGRDPVLKSILNSRKLTAIVDGVLSIGLPPKPRAYLAQEVVVRLTVGNLRGVPYAIWTKGPQGALHGMTKHHDYLGFIASFPAGRASTYRPHEEYRLPAEASATDPAWELFGRCALGSGAFPMFLEARQLHHSDYPGEYKRRLVPVVGEKCAEDIGSCYRVKPVSNEPEPIAGAPPYVFPAIDGGVFDNEPLELARTALAGPLDHNPRSGDEAFRGVLMIDPFIESLEKASISENEPIWKTGARLLTAWKMESRFNADELALANTPDNYSRYLLSPSRGTSDTVVPSHPLAAGGMSGFLGFFHRSYRHHDYMLGRRNMQRFLQRHFVLPANNPVFAGKWSAEHIATWRVDGEGGRVLLPIVPLVEALHPRTAASVEPLPDWPGVDLDMQDLLARIEVRLNRVVDAAIRELAGGWLARQAMRAAWRLFGRDKVVGKTESVLKEALRAQKLNWR